MQVGLCKPPNPIISIRMNARFAFLEMRSAEDATAALNLDGIPFGGASLSVGRPKKVRTIVVQRADTGWNGSNDSIPSRTRCLSSLEDLRVLTIYS